MNQKFEQSKKLTKADGTVAWVWEGKLHNWDEAALVNPDGKKEYYLNGIQVSKDRHHESKRIHNGLPWYKGAQRKGSRV